MVTDFLIHYKNLLESEEYNLFRTEHPGYYLAHGFVQLNKNYDEEKDWQIGLYSPEKDNLAVFNTNPIKHLSFDEAFKKEGIIQELVTGDDFLSTSECLEKAKELLIEKYKGELVMNVIVILQMIAEKAVYNFTFITQAFSMITIHVDVTSGEIIKEVKNSVLDLKKED